MKAKHLKNSNKHFTQADAIQAAADYGIDIAMLIDNLKRTPEERIRRHQIALNTVKSLRKAKRI
jgi:queuine/archaeosine tRNA-ribosyltransferase